MTMISKIDLKLSVLSEEILSKGGVRDNFNDILPLEVDDIDNFLPWKGLPLSCLHHVIGDENFINDYSFSPSASLFISVIASRLKNRGKILWCYPDSRSCGNFYAPTMDNLGLINDDIILVKVRSHKDTLWVIEQSLSCSDIAAVVSCFNNPLSFSEERRLQLAARNGKSTAFILHASQSPVLSSAAVTRWRISPLLSSVPLLPRGIGLVRWKLTLEKCRQGKQCSWVLEWCNETHSFNLAPLFYN